MKVLILYSELAGYVVKCIEKLSEQPGCEVSVVNWPVNKEAPFKFESTSVNYCNRSDFNDVQLLEFAKEFGPDIIIASGWMDKGYNKVCKYYRASIPVVACFDNHWVGSAKQRIVSLLSKFVIRDKFNRAWVPGEIQARFARKLGFDKDEISKGFYAADTETFVDYYQDCKVIKYKEFPKRILFVGRYVEHKGIFELWNAFLDLKSNSKYKDWELWCVGTGEEWDNRIEEVGIKHLGFLQPNKFKEVIDQTSVYVLPSKFEPWGVSLQEFAVAGYPLIASEAVGSTEAFCNKKNSFIFSHQNIDSLKKCLENSMNLTQIEYNKMASESHKLGLTITAEMWAETVMKIYNGKN